MEGPGDVHAAERALDAVGAIRQLVQAVFTLARAQQPRVDAAAVEASAYLGWVEELAQRFGAPSRATETESDRALWVLVGPERPFCGGLAQRLLEQLPHACPVVLVGRRLADAVPSGTALERRVVRSLTAAGGPEEIDACARSVALALLEIGHDGPVCLAHPVHGGSDLCRVPLLVGGGLRTVRVPETYSRPPIVFAAVINEALSGRLIVGIAEGLRTEVHARLLAAEAARRGCDRKLETLRQQWRVLRQEAITGELLELFSGRLAELGA